MINCKSFYRTILNALFVLLSSVLTTISMAAEDQPNIESSSLFGNEQVTDLIVILESDTARQKFLSNLKTLVKVTQENETHSFSLSTAFNIDGKSSNLLQSYYSFISEWGISDSAAGGFLVVAIVVILIFLGCCINNYLARKFNKKLISTRSKLGWSSDRFSRAFKGQKIAGYTVSLVFLGHAIAFTFGDTTVFPSQSQWLFEISGFVFSSLLVFLIVILAWEGINAAMEYGMNENSSLNSARVKTLIPVVRNLAFFVILLLSSLVILSELGIDIVPLLAGAGVLGIAIGFGAQTMVKDFLTGFVIVLEDLIQVGDVVGIGDRTGIVEKITLRKVQIRNLDGTVHTVPHSEISVVDNLTKEFSYYLLKVGVAYKEDTDNVIECLESIDSELRQDSRFGAKILAPIQILGVDEFADSAVIIKARTKTAPHEKWSVGREFNRRMKNLFDEKGIEIPFPHRTLYLANESSKLPDRIKNADA